VLASSHYAHISESDVRSLLTVPCFHTEAGGVVISITGLRDGAVVIECYWQIISLVVLRSVPA
jgi:hypothetical protein